MLPVDLRFVTRADPDLRVLVPSSSGCSRSFLVGSRGSRGVAVREGRTVDSRFFPHGDDFRGPRVAPDPPPGGDASSDSYCFVSSAASSASSYDSFTGESNMLPRSTQRGAIGVPRVRLACAEHGSPKSKITVASTVAVLPVSPVRGRHSTDR